MEHLKGLNDEQRKAVLEGDGATLVVAGPGSGKTRTIVHRICHQLDSGVAPERMLLLTFTNKAATEMKRRTRDLSGDAASRITAGTFHHFANLLLRRHASSAGLNPRFTILDEEDSITVLARVARRSFSDAKRAFASSLMRAISLSKLRMQPVSEIIVGDPDFFQMSKHVEEAESIARGYEQEKKSMDAVDFDDLLVFAHGLFQSNQHILSHYRSVYSDILVDEFQDTDRLQASFISLLYPPESPGIARNLMAVGDDSQSIYSFRGADIRNMLEFRDKYRAKVFFLSTNYRSSDPIVKLINRCMDGSKARIEKTLSATGKGGDIPRLIVAANPTEEAFVIARLAEQELL
jgi:DNA helicase-2/ATP-dependent DNA helicase PcrA